MNRLLGHLKLNTLYARLTLAFLVLIALCTSAAMYFSNITSELYSREVMQRQNRSVAMYIANQQPLISDGTVDKAAMDTLAERAMILNPSLQIYLIDSHGLILSHRLHEHALQNKAVQMEPVNALLSENSALPILGTDPLSTKTRTVFSAAPIHTNGHIEGYVYAVIGGERHQQLHASAAHSNTFRHRVTLFLFGALLAMIVGSALFFALTRRLTHLRRKVELLNLMELGSRSNESEPSPLPLIVNNETRAFSPKGSDEISELEHAFTKMASHLNQEFDALKAVDKTRRELIANVSHDLRTPLASMQGYIETLIVKDASFNDEQKREYLHIAHKHSKRLSDLVSELFELAKLEAEGVEPKMERFSLLELVYDSVQEFQLKAKDHSIHLDVNACEDYRVCADIALIHRVLQNLIDNALRHTPPKGTIKISVSKKNDKALVAVADTGKGIKAEELQYIFKRFYQSQQQRSSDKIGTGLGLAIVKRILDLHECRIQVGSKIDKGTTFIFELPLET